jgi:catechol 2,3-dioxygenase-like lactoylglutathione lyase family enzyme
MGIRRVVPDLNSKVLEETRNFYVDLFGFDVAMDMGWVVTLASPDNPTAQITISHGGSGSVEPNLTIEVDDVDEVHSSAVERGLDIVYPLHSEEWGVRRFFIRDPNGVVVNVLTHIH